MLIVLWLAYPVVWILGTEGTIEFIPLYVETAAFMVLDLTAKVGFGYVLLRSHNVLDEVAHVDSAPGAAVDQRLLTDHRRPFYNRRVESDRN